MRLGLVRVMRIDFIDHDKGPLSEGEVFGHSVLDKGRVYNLISSFCDTAMGSSTAYGLPLDAVKHPDRFERAFVFTMTISSYVHTLVVCADMNVQSAEGLLARETRFEQARQIGEDLLRITEQMPNYNSLIYAPPNIPDKKAPMILYLEPERDVNWQAEGKPLHTVAEELIHQLGVENYVYAPFFNCECLFAHGPFMNHFPFGDLTVFNIRASRLTCKHKDEIVIPMQLREFFDVMAAYHWIRYRLQELRAAGFDRYPFSKYLEKFAQLRKADQVMQMYEEYLGDLKRWAQLAPRASDELDELKDLARKRLLRLEQEQEEHPSIYFETYIPRDDGLKQISFLSWCRSKFDGLCKEINDLISRVEKENMVISNYIKEVLDQRLNRTNLDLQKRLEALTWIMLLLAILQLADISFIWTALRSLLRLLGF
jgi:hypothetical protein